MILWQSPVYAPDVITHLGLGNIARFTSACAPMKSLFVNKKPGKKRPKKQFRKPEKRKLSHQKKFTEFQKKPRAAPLKIDNTTPGSKYGSWNQIHAHVDFQVAANVHNTAIT